MTMRLRLLIATVPVLVAALTVGGECTSATNAALYHLGLVHSDPGCASGAALGPSTFQIAGLTLLVLVGILANSVAVREAACAYFQRLFGTVTPLRLVEPLPVTTDYSRHNCWRVVSSAGSRDPPTA